MLVVQARSSEWHDSTPPRSRSSSRSGNNKAFGHCSLALGACRFSGGTGNFTWFRGSVDVTHAPDYSLLVLGKGRTASVRLIEPRFSSRPRLHRRIRQQEHGSGEV